MNVVFGLKAESLERHERFIERALKNGSVWHLGREHEGNLFWAESTSNGSENGRGAGQTVVPLWSDRAYAKQCAKSEWNIYKPYEIPLERLLLLVLPNMQRAKVLVGTNWNAHLLGFEITPHKLKVRLQKAQKQGAAS